MLDGVRPGLRKSMEKLLNSYSAENGSNTPDFILAEYLMDCLRAFDSAVRARESWYGVKCAPGRSSHTSFVAD